MPRFKDLREEIQLVYLCHWSYFSLVKSCLSLSDPWTVAHQASQSFTIWWSFIKLLSFESMMSSHHFILFPPSLPAFNLSQHQGLFQWLLFTSDGQNIGASASVLLINIPDRFPLGLTGLISLLSKGHSRVFSSTTVWKHPFFGAQPILISIHDYWKNHSFE